MVSFINPSLESVKLLPLFCGKRCERMIVLLSISNCVVMSETPGGLFSRDS